MTEQWRPIPGWRGSYEVSDLGRVRSLDRKVPDARCGEVIHRGRVRAQFPSSHGYLMVGLYRQKRTVRLVHQLVLEAFVGPRPEGWHGCHNDGDRTNNELTNLRWDTPSSNALDMIAHGTHPKASKTHCKWGHEFTPENTKLRKNGGRDCATCMTRRSTEATRRFRAQRRAS